MSVASGVVNAFIVLRLTSSDGYFVRSGSLPARPAIEAPVELFSEAGFKQSLPSPLVVFFLRYREISRRYLIGLDRESGVHRRCSCRRSEVKEPEVSLLLWCKWPTEDVVKRTAAAIAQDENRGLNLF